MGGCPNNAKAQNSNAWKQNKMSSVVMKHGTPKEVVILRELKRKLRRSAGEAAKRSLNRKISMVVSSIERRRAHTKKKSSFRAAVSFA